MVNEIKLVWVIDPDGAWDILGDWAGMFGDNGGEPDGDAYLCDIEDIPMYIIDELVGGGFAKVVEGYVGEYPPNYHNTPPTGAQRWCGYQDREVVYWM